MSNGFKISNLLRKAADEVLSTTANECCNPLKMPPHDWWDQYSCVAVEDAISALGLDWYEFNDITYRVMTGLERMGCPTGSITAFDDVPAEVRQEYRHSWLYFAAMIAEEQGV